jgi:hypothetical protein
MLQSRIRQLDLGFPADDFENLASKMIDEPMGYDELIILCFE